LRACLNTGCALDALLGIDNGNQSLQIAEDVIGTGIDAFAAVFAKVL
jgi:hypothetical protein